MFASLKHKSGVDVPYFSVGSKRRGSAVRNGCPAAKRGRKRLGMRKVRSEYSSPVKVIHLYKIYTYFVLGADRQISL